MTSTPASSSDLALRSAVRFGAVGLIALTVVSIVVATLVAGVPGLWGALIGAAVGGIFVLATAVSVVLSAKLSPTAIGAVLLGGWVAKMLIAVLVLGMLSGMTFYDRRALGFVVIAALVIVLGAETYAVVKKRVLYVDPEPPGKRTGERGSS